MAKKEVKEEKRPVGRPTKYDPVLLKKVYKLCLLGCTDKKLADILDISESTLNLWKNEHPEFSECLRKGREDADSEVARSLYKRAKGYSFEEKTFESGIGIDEEGNAVRVMHLEKVVKKKQAPDTAAATFWLKNRQPDIWREKTEVEAKNFNFNIVPTEEEARKIKEDLEKSI